MTRLILIALCTIGLAAAQVQPAPIQPSIVIDAGTAGDKCMGGLTYTVAGLPVGIDTTLRFSAVVNGAFAPFSCVQGAIDPSIPYAIELVFVEPNVTGPGQRLFNVDMNGKRILDKLDIFKYAGALRQLSRYVIDFPLDGLFYFTFSPAGTAKGPVVTTIKITPLAAFPPNVTYIKSQDPKQYLASDYVAFKCPGCQYWMVPRPTIEPDATVQLLYTAQKVWRNGIRQTPGRDYQWQMLSNQLAVQPLTQWDEANDSVLVDYQATWPLAADALIPIVMDRKSCEGFGPNWDCRGIELLQFHTPSGVDFGPFIALRATAEEAADPNFKRQIGYGPWILQGVK